MAKTSTTALIAVAAAAVGLGVGVNVVRGNVPFLAAQPALTQSASNQNAQSQNTQSQNTQTPGAPVSDNLAASPATSPSGDATQPLGEAGAKLQNEANTISIVNQYEPGLVYVTTESAANPNPFGSVGQSGQTQQGVGSGFFVDQEGDILTNFHVVTQDGQTLNSVIKVRVQGQKDPVTAEIIGLAPQYDLALIRPKNIDKALIKPIPLGDSSTLKVGQKTVAMGAPFGFDFSVTEGIVSSTERQIPIGFSLSAVGNEGITQKAIQTDAAINPGNSGGPLLDSTGRIIGINTQIISPAGAQSGVGQSAGVGFAIPINTAKNLLTRLKDAKGGLVLAPTIGVEPGLVTSQSTAAGTVSVPLGTSALTDQARRQYNLPPSGFLIGKVVPNSPAAKAGLRGASSVEQVRGGQISVGGDVIVSADGNPVDSREDLQASYIAKTVGDSVKFQVVNGGKTRTVNVTLDQSSFATQPLN